MGNDNRDPQQSGMQNPNDPANKQNRQEDPQQTDIRRPDDVIQDPSKKAPGQDFDRKDREGSEDIEKRRAS